MVLPSKRAAVVSVLLCLLADQASAICDEANSFEKTRDPLVAKADYENANFLYATRTPLGHCNAVKGFPASLARPALWSTPMFTDKTGVVKNTAQVLDLPVIHRALCRMYSRRFRRQAPMTSSDHASARAAAAAGMHARGRHLDIFKFEVTVAVALITVHWSRTARVLRLLLVVQTPDRRRAAPPPLRPQSFAHEGRHLDVYERIDLIGVNADFFKGFNTDPAKPTANDACRPAGYVGTRILTYSSATQGAFTPGPTHKNCVGRQSIVRFCNNLPPDFTGAAVHLHGSASTGAYECKDYHYPNNRATHLWYHDHTIDFTADNTYHGLAGNYFVRDCDAPVELNYMPKDPYNVPLVLKDVVFDNKVGPGGILPLIYQGGFRPHVGSAHVNNIYGDIQLVNGRTWPVMKVERRTYRFSQLNASNSRQYSVKWLAETADGKTQAWVDFYLVNTDGGELQVARKLRHLHHTVAERYEYLINFAPAGLPPITNGVWKYVYFVNDYGQKPNSDANPFFCKSHLLARFDLDELPLNTDPRLAAGVDAAGAWPPPTETSKGALNTFRGLHNLISNTEYEAYKKRALAGDFDRQFQFNPSGGQWAVNGVTWHDTFNRILANPARDGIELWKIQGGGGWRHPVHVHLVDFLILAGNGRKNNDQWQDWDALTGSTGLFSSYSPFACFDNTDCPTSMTCVKPAPRNLRGGGGGGDDFNAPGINIATNIQVSVNADGRPQQYSSPPGIEKKCTPAPTDSAAASGSGSTTGAVDPNSINTDSLALLGGAGGATVGTTVGPTGATNLGTAATGGATVGTGATPAAGAGATPVPGAGTTQAAGAPATRATTPRRIANGTCTLKAPCTIDEQCVPGTYCVAGSCVENQLRKWEHDSPKDVGHLGNGHSLWYLARFGPIETDYMFHCHNTVHEDNAMMIAFGTGRVKPGVPNPWGPQGVGAVPGDDLFVHHFGQKYTPVDLWAPGPYPFQLAPQFASGDALSPLSSTDATGLINSDQRNPESNLSFPAATASAFTTDYTCPRFYSAVYDVYYACNPPARVAGLPVRDGVDTHNVVNTQTVFPNYNVPNTFFYNPIRQNAWSVDYTLPNSANPAAANPPLAGPAVVPTTTFIKRAATWLEDACVQFQCLNRPPYVPNPPLAAAPARKLANAEPIAPLHRRQ
ncbi:hypothetical protein JKP88DRAFT_247177 [Tribonema minus]|uniref:Plastocyanin-like domain-containing protein n=1 Tax=Tribonema minus TaxID=303371 RepID=A0A835YUU4_9STRA|nr:hypothetical protein JKP88DRAFT_247177 [Tribonema minus]